MHINMQVLKSPKSAAVEVTSRWLASVGYHRSERARNVRRYLSQAVLRGASSDCRMLVFVYNHILKLLGCNLAEILSHIE